jgi:hypothetical protein
MIIPVIDNKSWGIEQTGLLRPDENQVSEGFSGIQSGFNHGNAKVFVRERSLQILPERAARGQECGFLSFPEQDKAA